MSWGKKALVPLRVIAVTAERSVVWDESNDKLGYIERRDRDDPASFDQLRFREGERPIVFTLRPGLPPGIVARLRSHPHPEDKLLAFQFGVAECTHSGELGLQWEHAADAPHIRLTTLTKVPPKVWQEIGALVLRREDLTEGE
jgi:hypothetical protein